MYKYLVQTLRAPDAATDPINLAGPFTVSLISSMFRGVASVQKSLDNGVTWETIVDFPMSHISGESLDHSVQLDEPEQGGLLRGYVTSHEFGSVIIRFDQYQP